MILFFHNLFSLMVLIHIIIQRQNWNDIPTYNKSKISCPNMVRNFGDPTILKSVFFRIHLSI